MRYHSSVGSLACTRMIGPLAVVLVLCTLLGSAAAHSPRTAHVLNFLKRYTGLTSPIQFNDTNKPIRSGRQTPAFNWEVNRDIVESIGHPFCGGVMRDNWLCTGDTYEKVLQKTKPLNKNKFAMQNFSRATFIMATGNSLLAELMSYWLCESGAEVFSEAVCSSRGCSMSTVSNSLIAVSGQTVLLLICNDVRKQEFKYFEKLMSALATDMKVCPELVIEGHHNSWTDRKPYHNEEAARFRAIREMCPGAAIVPMYSSPLGAGCSAEFLNCGYVLSCKFDISMT